MKERSRDELTDPTMKAAFNSLMFEVEGNEYRGYSFIIEEAKNCTLKMVADIIAGLLNRYNVNYQSIDFRRLGISPTPVFAFVHIRNEGNAFYIIKEFGMNNSIDTSTLRELTKRMNARYAYVSLARENAFAEVFDYNDNADDPTRLFSCSARSVETRAYNATLRRLNALGSVVFGPITVISLFPIFALPPESQLGDYISGSDHHADALRYLPKLRPAYKG